MSSYIIKRIIQMVIVLVIVTVLVFVGMRALPGDPIRMLVTRDQLTQMSQEQIDQLRHEAGLDRHIAVQYFTWVGGLFKGDMGRSIVYKTPVRNEIFRRLPITLYIGLTRLDHRHTSGGGRRHTMCRQARYLARYRCYQPGQRRDHGADLLAGPRPHVHLCSVAGVAARRGLYLPL